MVWLIKPLDKLFLEGYGFLNPSQCNWACGSVWPHMRRHVENIRQLTWLHFSWFCSFPYTQWWIFFFNHLISCSSCFSGKHGFRLLIYPFYFFAEFNLSEKQAEAILDFNFRRLNVLEVNNLILCKCNISLLGDGSRIKVLSKILILLIVQRKKFVNESELLKEQISKLEELLSSKKHILQV